MRVIEMRTLEQAVRYAEALQEADQGRYVVVYSRGFIGQGPYFVVEAGQVPLLVEEGARVVWEQEKVLA